MSEPASEDDLIATIFAPIAGPGALGLRDDVACFTPPPGCDLIVTNDALVAGVHFLPDDPPASIARKALRVNVSDVVAKGAEPQGFLLAAALPAHIDMAWLRAFAQALGEDARAYGCPLLGGDTVRTPGPMTLSITALGAVPTGRMAARTGARAGDAIYVSGSIGDGAIGLHARLGTAPWAARLGPASRAYLEDRYLTPQPRFALRHAVRDHAHGSMDVSDGLVGDLAKMMRASGAGARVELARAPLSAPAREAIALDDGLFETAMTGGDDYEILCTVAGGDAPAFEAAALSAGVQVTRIGEVTEAGGGIVFLGRDGAEQAFRRPSYSHF
ncbi:MAG: thiamine-monophosphate kinase [Hyphomicrobiales bacterium]|nr:thiamine-monophosphate kinase [Hyphomicrobiales bacterium]